LDLVSAFGVAEESGDASRTAPSNDRAFGAISYAGESAESEKKSRTSCASDKSVCKNQNKIG
jgi:hypothetical protein